MKNQNIFIRFLKIGKYGLSFVLVFPLFFIQSTHIQKIENTEKISNHSNVVSNWVDSLMNTMSLDQKIGQLFMAAAYPKQGPENTKHVVKLINDYHIGGLIFFLSQGLSLKQS
jgi:hypothetical protein